jgi:hypothetical protein
MRPSNAQFTLPCSLNRRTRAGRELAAWEKCRDVPVHGPRDGFHDRVVIEGDDRVFRPEVHQPAPEGAHFTVLGSRALQERAALGRDQAACGEGEFVKVRLALRA